MNSIQEKATNKIKELSQELLDSDNLIKDLMLKIKVLEEYISEREEYFKTLPMPEEKASIYPKIMEKSNENDN